MTRPNGVLMTFLWRLALRIMFCSGYIQEALRRNQALRAEYDAWEKEQKRKKAAKGTDADAEGGKETSSKEAMLPAVEAQEPVGPMNEINYIINQLFQKKVWSEITSGINALDREDLYALLDQFEKIYDEHGANSDKMFSFFERLTRKFSQTYYVFNTLGTSASSRWDEALKDLT